MSLSWGCAKSEPVEMNLERLLTALVALFRLHQQAHQGYFDLQGCH